MYFICFRWRNKPANKVWWNRTKHPKRWDSMPHWYFSLPIVDFDSPMWYIACVLLSLRWSYVYCSWCACFIGTLSTWLLFLCYWYMSTSHHIFLLTTYTILPLSYFHKLLVETLMYMHGSRYVVILLMKLCEGSPPKNTRDIVDEFVWGESPPRSLMVLIGEGHNVERDICMLHVEFINYSCRYMPLDASRNFLQSVPLLWNIFKIVSFVESSCNFFCD